MIQTTVFHGIIVVSLTCTCETLFGNRELSVVNKVNRYIDDSRATVHVCDATKAKWLTKSWAQKIPY